MPPPLTPGLQNIDGTLINQIMQQLFGYLDNITAHAGGGQTNAVKLTAGLNYISTVASSGDSVELPTANPNPGLGAGISMCVIHNAGANPANVYPPSGGQVNEGGANTAYSLTNGDTGIFFCMHSGEWSGGKIS